MNGISVMYGSSDSDPSQELHAYLHGGGTERNGTEWSVCRHALDINIDGWIEYNGNTMQIKWRAPPFAENDNVNSIIPKPYLLAVVQQT
jgi:hypothetical protein